MLIQFIFYNNLDFKWKDSDNKRELIKMSWTRLWAKWITSHGTIEINLIIVLQCMEKTSKEDMIQGMEINQLIVKDFIKSKEVDVLLFLLTINNKILLIDTFHPIFKWDKKAKIIIKIWNHMKEDSRI